MQMLSKFSIHLETSIVPVESRVISHPNTQALATPRQLICSLGQVSPRASGCACGQLVLRAMENHPAIYIIMSLCMISHEPWDRANFNLPCVIPPGLQTNSHQHLSKWTCRGAICIPSTDAGGIVLGQCSQTQKYKTRVWSLRGRLHKYCHHMCTFYMSTRTNRTIIHKRCSSQREPDQRRPILSEGTTIVCLKPSDFTSLGSLYLYFFQYNGMLHQREPANTDSGSAVTGPFKFALGQTHQNDRWQQNEHP